MEHIEEYFGSKSQKIKQSNEKILNLIKNSEIDNSLHEELLTADTDKQEMWGQFHTPEIFQNLVIRSLPHNIVEKLSFGKTLIDPSCGTGNFLLLIIEKSLRYFEKKATKISTKFDLVNQLIIPNIFGAEIDHVLIQITKKIIRDRYQGKIRCPRLYNLDILRNNSSKKFKNKFDFIIGNPPWVEVKKLPTDKKKFIQNKYNTNNLYSAFLLEALNMVKEDGCVCFILPRSFTGGAYFSNVRKELRGTCSLKSLYYIKERKQRFHGGKILQEIVIPCFYKKISNSKVKCFPLDKVGNETSNFHVNQDEIYSDHDNILLLAKNFEELLWIRKILKLKSFEEHGFQFSTGQLVTHRARDFLRSSKEKNTYPIIYAHNIVNDPRLGLNLDLVGKKIKDRLPYGVLEGLENFDGRKKNKAPKRSSLRKWLNHYDEIVIMRRRSHKGDKRRFMGAYCSNNLSTAYFLDNSVNYIVQRKEEYSPINLKVFYRILSSDTFERFFEAVSSNTQINKNDMYLFGLPDEQCLKIIKEIENAASVDSKKINRLVKALYDI